MFPHLNPACHFGMLCKYIKYISLIKGNAESRWETYQESKRTSLICNQPTLFSSLEPLGSQGELIVYPSSRRPCAVVVRPPFSKIFFKTAWPIKAKFYMEPPWEGGTKVCINGPGHMTKMAPTPIYGKKTFKNLLLWNRRADFHETWRVASGSPAHHSLFK